MSLATMRSTSSHANLKVGSSRPAVRPFVACPARQQRLAPVRASPVVSEIVDKLKTLTLLEASELVKEIEKTFGVDASAPSGGMMMAMAPAGGAAPAEAPKEEEKTAFDVVLESFDTAKKIVLLKVLRGVTGMGLNETKAFIDGLPKAVKTAVAKDEADKILKELGDAGGKCKIV